MPFVNNHIPSAPVIASEYRDLLDEIHAHYLRVNTHLEFKRESKTFVQMYWHIECDQPCSLLVERAISFAMPVEGNKAYNVMQTLYNALWCVIDSLEADIAEQTKMQLFPAT